MSSFRPVARRAGLIGVVLTAGLAVLISVGRTEAERCSLPAHHAGVVFPLDQIEATWSCRLEPIVTQYTTANKVGLQRTPLPRSVFLYFLDHPAMAAMLVNRLDLGLYKAEQRGQGEFWATDGEGTEGIVYSLFRDSATRIYYVEGSHDGRFLPRVSGKAVVLLRLRPVSDNRGVESIDSMMVTYLRLDNRFLSGMLSLLRPLIGNVVNRQLLKAFDAARRLGRAMREHPEQVLFEATDPPALPDDEVVFLKAALAGLHNPVESPHSTP
ncbi:MAG: hypothetical protein H8K10_15245 [Nitrospira sp.]|nr:hypothetical protein [Nitrospira sp.]